MLIENGVVLALHNDFDAPFEVAHVELHNYSGLMTLILTGRDPGVVSYELYPEHNPTLIQQLLACGVQIQDGTT